MQPTTKTRTLKERGSTGVTKKERVADIIFFLKGCGYNIDGLNEKINKAFPGRNRCLYGIWYHGYFLKRSIETVLGGFRNRGIFLKKIPETQKVTLFGYKQSVSWFLAHGWWQCLNCGGFNHPIDFKCPRCDHSR